MCAARTRLAVLPPISSPKDAQEVLPWPIEGWCSPHDASRWRRECVGSIIGGVLIVSEVVTSSGVRLLFRRKYGNPTQPKRGEVSDAMRRWLLWCWRDFMHQAGKPVIEKQGDLYFLCRMPRGRYIVENERDDSTLYRLHPLIQRPRASLSVPLGQPVILPASTGPGLPPRAAPRVLDPPVIEAGRGGTAAR